MKKNFVLSKIENDRDENDIFFDNILNTKDFLNRLFNRSAQKGSLKIENDRKNDYEKWKKKTSKRWIKDIYKNSKKRKKAKK